jgi:hypothetical protein
VVENFFFIKNFQRTWENKKEWAKCAWQTKPVKELESTPNLTGQFVRALQTTGF